MAVVTTSTSLKAVMNTSNGDTKNLTFKYVNESASGSDIRALISTIVSNTEYLSYTYTGASKLQVIKTETTTTDVATS